MKTPICDFVRAYCESNPTRLHMPGHKGTPLIGPEALDITEIEGADSLFEASGIILESEQNAGKLFGAITHYSAEGSSLVIRTMLAMTLRYAKAMGRAPIIAATQNAHKVFLSGIALLGIELCWLPSKQEDGYLSCSLSAGEAEAFFKACRELPTALYVTSPDYLGNTLDISALAEMCHRYGVLLLVDNAHGAYLKFLSPSRHPIDLGADACADSAHKTLPALTGAAYLHISKNAPPAFAASAKDSMALFASTSPSYLILQSLDALNAHLAQGYARRLASFVLLANQQKQLLCEHGFVFLGNEPLKWTIDAKRIGYTGKELADLLSARGLVCEFSDPDYLVLMLSPEAGASVLDRVYRVLLEIEQRPAITTRPPAPVNRPTVLSPRVALLSPMELIPTEEASGRILASPTVSCPPAVPIVRIGERIDSAAIEAFHYYSIKICLVVKE